MSQLPHLIDGTQVADSQSIRKVGTYSSIFPVWSSAKVIYGENDAWHLGIVLAMKLYYFPEGPPGASSGQFN